MARRRLRWLRLGRGAGAGLLAGTVAWASWGQAPGLPADTAAVSALIRQGEAQETQQPAAARASYARALAAAERLHFDQGYFRGMRLLTFALNNVGRHEEARRLALRALGRARQDTSQYHLGLCYFALGVTAWRQGDYPEAVRQYHQAEYYMERLHRTYNLERHPRQPGRYLPGAGAFRSGSAGAGTGAARPAARARRLAGAGHYPLQPRRHPLAAARRAPG